MKITSIIFALCITIGSYSYAMDNEIKIKPYQDKRDCPAIEKILKSYPDLTYEALGKPEGTTKEYLESKKYCTDVLIHNNTTVGFVNYIGYDAYLFTFFLGRYGIIRLIEVDQDNQRKGFGTQLLQHTINELEKRKAPSISLTVKSDNTNARAFYEKEGFTCTVPEHMKTKTSQIVYQKLTNVSPDELPQGNIIQRYPRTFMATLLVGCGVGITAYKKLKA